MRTPGVPGRSAAHHPGLAGLHTLQEVVVLLLLAGLLRPVEEVVLGESHPTEVVPARPHVLSCLVIQPDTGEGESVGDDVVKLGVVDQDSVAQAGLQVEEAVGVDLSGERLGVGEGVTHPGVHRGHAAAPQRGVRHVLLDVEGEGLLPDTPLHILDTPHLRAEAADELPRLQVGGVSPSIAGAVRTEGDGGGRNPRLDKCPDMAQYRTSNVYGQEGWVHLISLGKSLDSLLKGGGRAGGSSFGFFDLKNISMT